MTPCEKLGYKVSDRFIAQKDGNTTKRGDILTLREDDGSRMPLFQNERTKEATYEYIQKYDDMWPEGVWVLPENPKPSTLKNPIEYLKTAHANGDTIYPETMLRECFGITKTERVVTEWSVVKREIKVGDKVRLLQGGGKFPLNGYENGGIYTVQGVDYEGDFELSGGEVPQGYARPSSVELI